MCIALGHRIGESSHFSHVIRIADVVHIALGRGKACPVLADNIDARVGTMQPDRRRRSRYIEDHSNSVGLHLVHDLVEPLKGEFALRRLERVPGQISHADHVEAGTFHNRDVLIDLLRRAIDRLITGAHEELSGTGPVRMHRRHLGKRHSAQDAHEDERHR
jgi:hypothetical protein